MNKDELDQDSTADYLYLITGRSSEQDSKSCPTEDDLGVGYYVFCLGSIFVISAISISGNALVIQTVARHKKLREPGSYYILSLACSDLLLGVIYPVYNASHIYHERIYKTLGIWPSCSAILTLTLGMLFVSSYNLVGITVTRYLSIMDPLKFKSRFTHKRALTAVLLTWVLITSVSVGLYVRPEEPEHYCHCRYETVLNKTHIGITACFNVILPLTVMTIMYARMTMIARKQIKVMLALEAAVIQRTETEDKRILLKKELKLFKMSGLLIFYYALLWIPFVIYEFVILETYGSGAGYSHEDDNPWIRAIVRLLLHMNTAVNVVVYTCGMKDFRAAIQNDLRQVVSRVRSFCRRHRVIMHGSTKRQRNHDNHPRGTGFSKDVSAVARPRALSIQQHSSGGSLSEDQMKRLRHSLSNLGLSAPAVSKISEKIREVSSAV